MVRLVRRYTSRRTVRLASASGPFSAASTFPRSRAARYSWERRRDRAMAAVCRWTLTVCLLDADWFLTVFLARVVPHGPTAGSVSRLDRPWRGIPSLFRSLA